MKKEKFLRCFTEFGRDWRVTDEILIALEEFVCCLFNAKSKTVNSARFEIFQKKYTKESKTINISLLPPCYASLLLHIKRSNFVADMWKRLTNPIIELPEISDYGWNEDGTIEWIVQPYPDEICDLLVQVVDEMDYDIVDFESDIETDSEDEMVY